VCVCVCVLLLCLVKVPIIYFILISTTTLVFGSYGFETAICITRFPFS
jgi:hypothetical protein